MRLILREYLALMKESGEIDALIPDLLLNMGIRPINRAGVGNRQLGVDIPAAGIDPADGVRKLFLVTAKRGNITRTVWDTTVPDAVRPSLNEIRDRYLRSEVEPAHRGLPVVIVLATGGDMDENVHPDWVAHVENNAGTVTRGGTDYEVSFAFWGGDALADLVDRYLVDEYLFPEDAQSVMRRTLALVGDPAFDLGPFEEMVDRTLRHDDMENRDKRLRSLRFLRLAVRVVYRWAEREGNLRPALLAAEYVFLRVWGTLVDRKLVSPKRRELPELAGFYEAWRDVLQATYDALQPHVELEHGLFGHSDAEEVEYGLRVYDLLGHFALAGIDEFFLAAQALVLAAEAQDGDGGGGERASVSDDQVAADSAPMETDPEVDPRDGLHGRMMNEVPNDVRAAAHRANARAVANRVASIIVNNPAANAPPFDEHAVEVGLVLWLLAVTGNEELARHWVRDLSGRMAFAAAHVKGGFPLYASSHDELADYVLGMSQGTPAASTILPLLAEWALLLGDDDLYRAIRRDAVERTGSTNLQTWYPTAATPEALFHGPAIDTGLMRVSVELPENPAEFRAQVLHERTLEKDIPPYPSGPLHVLPLLASRRFRTPLRPEFWRRLIHPVEESAEGDDAESD